MPIGPRVLTTLSAAGRIVRATNDGGWAVVAAALDRDGGVAGGGDRVARRRQEGVAGLVERWLRAFGPGTEADIKWWLGSTLAAVRRALADLGAVEVDLDGDTGYLLPDDLEPVEPVEPWAALLPPLDPTTMGWTRARLVPRPLQGAAVRHRRQRRPDRLVGRADRRRLAPDRERRRRAAAARGRRRRGAARARARGRDAERVVRRHASAAAVPLAPFESAGRRLGLAPTIACRGP